MRLSRLVGSTYSRARRVEIWFSLSVTQAETLSRKMRCWWYSLCSVLECRGVVIGGLLKLGNGLSAILVILSVIGDQSVNALGKKGTAVLSH